MKKRKSIVFFLIAILFIFAVPSMAAAEFPDMKGHWAGGSVKVLTEKNIIAGWGGLFHPEDTVKANEYIKMVVTALGYTDIKNYPGDWARDYIIKATELGLIFDGEISNYNEPISRGMMAKIAMRALQDEAVPEYIEAYKGMVLDYDSIDPDMQLDILKCIEKGILKGMPDSTFRPNTNCTRAEAATVIHRMISQEERNKAKPVFAKIDPEFEAIINGPEAEKYINMEHIEYYGKGILAISTWDKYTEKLLLPVGEYPNVNKDVYNLLAALAKKAKEYEGYVRVIGDIERKGVMVEYFSLKQRGQGFTQGWPEFKAYIDAIPMYGEGYFPELREYMLTWCINSLHPDKYDLVNPNDWLHPSMPDIIKSGFCAVYGSDDGLALADHGLKEYEKAAVLIPDYVNESLQEVNGIKIKNSRNLISNLGYFTFSTVLPK